MMRVWQLSGATCAGRLCLEAALFAEQLRHALPPWPPGLGHGR